MPLISTALMSFYSGCFAAGGSTVLLIDVVFEKGNIDYYIQFAFLAVAFAIFVVIKIIYWTPLFMPTKQIAFHVGRNICRGTFSVLKSVV